MKALVILGVPRAGKTRLSTVVAEQLAKQGYITSILPADVIRSCLDKVRKTWFYRYIVRPSRHIFPFVGNISSQRLTKNMLIFSKNFIRSIPDDKIVIFEGAYIDPNLAAHNFDLTKTKIVVIGYTKPDIEQKMSDIRKYNRGVSPLRNKSDSELRERVKKYVDISRDYKKMADKHGFVFLDTSNDYHGTINSFAENIVEFLSK